MEMLIYQKVFKNACEIDIHNVECFTLHLRQEIVFVNYFFKTS